MAAAAFESATKELAPAVVALRKAAEETQRGAETSSEALKKIERAIAALEKEPTCGSVDGVWKLLWTTEKVGNLEASTSCRQP